MKRTLLRGPYSTLGRVILSTNNYFSSSWLNWLNWYIIVRSRWCMAMSSRVAALFFSSLKSAHMVYGNWGYAPDPTGALPQTQLDSASTDPHGWFKGSARETAGEKWKTRRDERGWEELPHCNDICSHWTHFLGCDMCVCDICFTHVLLIIYIRILCVLSICLCYGEYNQSDGSSHVQRMIYVANRPIGLYIFRSVHIVTERIFGALDV